MKKDNIINGNNLAEEILDTLRKRITPKKELHAIMVGADKASLSFLKKKSKIAESLGVKFVLHELSTSITQAELIDEIAIINKKENIGGIIVQLPLPKKYNRDEVLKSISPEKDVDALRGKVSQVLPPAVGTLEYILNKIEFDIKKKEVVIIGSGFLVGLPISNWLKDKTNQLTVINKGELKENSLLNTDLIITATGVPELVKGTMIKKDVVVIDYGYGRKDEKLCGDIETKSIQEIASYFTPTPGGTGPIVVAKLFENFYKLNT